MVSDWQGSYIVQDIYATLKFLTRVYKFIYENCEKNQPSRVYDYSKNDLMSDYILSPDSTEARPEFLGRPTPITTRGHGEV